MSDRNTTIRVTAGTDIDVENQNGGRIRVLVVRADVGNAARQEINTGACVCDVVGDTSQEIRVNGEIASANQELHEGDRVTVTPTNPEGNVRG